MGKLEKKLKEIPLTNSVPEAKEEYDCNNCVERVSGVGGTPCLGCPGPYGVPDDSYRQK